MRLADCFIEMLSYAKLFLRKPEGDYDTFRRRIDELVAASGEAARAHGASDEAYRDALFAAMAYVDEAVLTSGWSEATRWQGQQLQKQHFGTTRGGVEFFKRLEALPAAEKAVREVFYFCLMLGFKGQYVFAEDQGTLENLKQQQLQMLVKGSETAGLDATTVLFPGAYPEDNPTAAPRRQGPARSTLAWIIAPPLAVALLYGFYTFSLDQLVGNFNLFMK